MNSLSTDHPQFINTYNNGQTQLFWTWIEGDLETPVSAYLKLCSDQTHSFLLESVEGGENLGRYSIIGFDPDLIWTHNNGETTIQKDGATSTDTRTPMESLKDYIQSNHIDHVPESGALPPMAVSGLFGYLGYDTIRWVENIPNNTPDDLNIPDALLMRPKILVIFDNVRNMICIVKAVHNHVNNSAQSANEALLANQGYVDNIIQRLHAPISADSLNATSALQTPLRPKSNTDKNDFKTAVEKAKEYIFDGDIFQVVLAQRFEVPFDLPSFDLYRSLRRLNPSPFLFHIKIDDFALVGSSPEVLVRCRDNTVTIRPIAGTRKRGATKEEDLALEKDLLADEKERAEHLMLLDLGRNDVGAVSEYGSVKVTDSYIIERYSHVMHIVSNVEGTLAKDKDSVDAFFSGFPAGTVSGAPKIRAMEIIDELEQNARKSYAGAVGYFSSNGDIDSCIALRTGLVKDGKLYVQAGGGIVADSDPEFEYQESVNKAKAVLSAAELAVDNSKQR